MKHRRLVLLLSALAGLCLSACNGGGNSGDVIAVPGNQTLSGVVHGGQSPVSGSMVSLYAVGSGGGAATLLASSSTDADGRFMLSGYGCPTATPPVYLVARGGNPGLGGSVTNGALHMLSALGGCQAAAATVNIDEVTTAAAAYALNAFIDPADSDDLHGVSPGLDNAMAMTARLADAASGALGPALTDATSGCGGSAPVNCDAARRLNALANSLAACVNTAGGNSSQCTELFDCATPGATYTGSHACTAGTPTGLPTDTWQAALAIARNPGTLSADGLYDTATQNAVFSPTLTAAPGDWALALNFADVGVSEPTDVALDAAGNVWIANYNDRVVELAPNGSALSGVGGYTGGGLHESFGIAIDAGGHVWVANEESTGGFNSNHGSITELDGGGHVLSGVHGYAGGGLDFPQALAIDATGNVWAVNAGNASVSEFSPMGAVLSPAAGYTGGGVSYPVDLAFDPAGDLWIANQAANEISKLSAAGAPLSPVGGYTGGGLKVPQGVAVDTHGNVWISNDYGDSVTELDSTGVPVSPTAYAGGGLRSPGGIAIDGAGRAWVANFNGASLSELAGADDLVPGAPLSPAAGFTAGNFSQPYAPAIDASGNVWVANFGNDSVTVLVGAAAPVKMPRIGVPVAP